VLETKVIASAWIIKFLGVKTVQIYLWTQHRSKLSFIYYNYLRGKDLDKIYYNHLRGKDLDAIYNYNKNKLIQFHQKRRNIMNNNNQTKPYPQPKSLTFLSKWCRRFGQYLSSFKKIKKKDTVVETIPEPQSSVVVSANPTKNLETRRSSSGGNHGFSGTKAFFYLFLLSALSFWSFKYYLKRKSIEENNRLNKSSMFFRVGLLVVFLIVIYIFLS
jgi:hypothetical protein